MNTTKWVAVGVLLLAAPILTGCCGIGCGSLPRLSWSLPQLRTLKGSGDLVALQMDYEGFTGLDISHAFVVQLTQSDAYQVAITVDDNLQDMVQVSQAGNTLRLGLDSDTLSVSDLTLKAEIAMPTLRSAKLSGASRLEGDIDTGDLRFELSGASRIELEGTGGDLQLHCSGASHVDLASFLVGDANVLASGASQVTVHVSGRLEVDASGASRVEYLGKPTLGRIESSGASDVGPR